MKAYNDIEQGTDEWFALRAELPTASEFSKLITSAGKPSKSLENYAIKKGAELYAGKPLESWEGNQWTERGNILEEEARAWYSFMSAEVTQVGFVVNHGAGCSPDGFVGDRGMVEFKCLSPVEHVKALQYWRENNRIPTTYVAQCQGELYVCERAWVDLVFYHPDLPKVVARVTPDLQFFAALARQIADFIEIRDETVAQLREE